MKKILLVALTLLVTGTMYADKKCCKDKASCSKSEVKSCAKSSKDKACCKKGSASADANASTNDAVASESMHACCKKSVAAGGKACCAKPSEKAAHPAEAPVRDDGQQGR